MILRTYFFVFETPLGKHSFYLSKKTWFNPPFEEIYDQALNHTIAHNKLNSTADVFCNHVSRVR